MGSIPILGGPAGVAEPPSADMTGLDEAGVTPSTGGGPVTGEGVVNRAAGAMGVESAYAWSVGLGLIAAASVVT